MILLRFKSYGKRNCGERGSLKKKKRKRYLYIFKNLEIVQTFLKKYKNIGIKMWFRRGNFKRLKIQKLFNNFSL